MVFSSSVFLILFLPLTIVAYYNPLTGWFCKKYKWTRNVILLVSSLIFYAWGEPLYVFLMLFSILVTFLTGIGVASENRNISRLFLYFGSKTVICIGFWIAIYAFMSVALVRLMTRQILVKRFHMNNEVVQFVYGGNRTLLEEANEYAGKAKTPIDWEKQYPHSNKVVDMDIQNVVLSEEGKTVHYLSIVDSIKTDISNYVNKYHPWLIYMKWLSGDYDLVTMGTKSALARNNVYVAHDEWLYSYSNNTHLYDERDINELADYVEDLYDYCKYKNIGFFYLSASSKPSPYDDEAVSYEVDDENSNKARFLKALDERNVPEIDLSREMPRDPQTWYSLYYKTDGHWNDKAGLWVSRVIAEYLNDNNGFSFDSSLFDQRSYIEDIRSEWFRGGTARNLSPSLIKKESLTRYIPQFNTDYVVTHYSENGVENREGSFIDVFFNNDVYNSMGTMSEKDIYEGTRGDHRFIENDDLYTIINRASPDNKGKKILMLRDSYTSYVAPYLSTDVGELDLIYLPKFSGSIREYINKNKPDEVIMLLYEDNIAPESAQSEGQGFHFDLR